MKKIFHSINIEKSILAILAFLFIANSSFSQDLTNGLKLHYTFKELSNSKVKDQVGNNDGTLLNGATIGSDGTHLYLDFPDVAGTARPYLDMGGATGEIISQLSDVTISFFMKVPTGYKSDFTWNFSNSENIGTDANGHMFFDCVHQKTAITPTHHGAEAGNKIEIGSSVPTDVWFHYAFTLESYSGKYYINATELGTATFATQPKDLGVTEFNWIGRCSYDGGGTMAGQYNVNPAQIADFRIYNRALSAAEISALSALKTSNQQSDKSRMEIKVISSPGSDRVNFNYQIEKSGKVSIEVFTIDGKKVETLVDQVQSQGHHQINWKAPKCGIYLYQLKTADQKLTGKFLIK